MRPSFAAEHGIVVEADPHAVCGGRGRDCRKGHERGNDEHTDEMLHWAMSSSGVGAGAKLPTGCEEHVRNVSPLFAHRVTTPRTSDVGKWHTLGAS